MGSTIDYFLARAGRQKKEEDEEQRRVSSTASTGSAAKPAASAGSSGTSSNTDTVKTDTSKMSTTEYFLARAGIRREEQSADSQHTPTTGRDEEDDDEQSFWERLKEAAAFATDTVYGNRARGEHRDTGTAGTMAPSMAGTSAPQTSFTPQENEEKKREIKNLFDRMEEQPGDANVWQAAWEAVKEHAGEMWDYATGDLARDAGYGTERLASGLLGFGEGVTDFVGAGGYTLLEQATSLGGLAPNKVSEWLGSGADNLLNHSITQDYEESIKRRYNPTEFEELTTGVGQNVAQILATVGVGKVLGALAQAGNSAMATMRGADAATKAANIGKGVFGTFAAGNAASEAKSEGATRGQALGYGAAVGMMETIIESVSGGIPGLDDSNMLRPVVSKVISNPVVQRVIDIMGEGAEEGASEFLTPYIKRAFYDADAKTATVDEIAESAVLGMVVSALFQAGIEIPAGMSAYRAYSQQASQMDGDVVQAIIDEGLASDPTSKSYKMAAEMQEKQQVGDPVSQREVQRLYRENVKTINAENAQAEEARTVEQDIEDAAREAVGASAAQGVQDVSEQNVSQPVREEVALKTQENAKQSVPYNVLATDHPARQARMSLEQMTGYGEHGAKTFANIVESSNADPGKVRLEFQSAYEAGLTDLPRERANLLNGVQEEAYNAGRLDYIMQMGKHKDQRFAPRMSNEAGFERTNLPDDVTEYQWSAVNLLAKGAGVKVRMATGLKGNAEIAADGTVLIDRDFQREVNGKQRSVVFYAAHEIGMHRLMQLAPEEGRAFINAVVQKENAGLEYGQLTETEKKQESYARQNVDLTTDKAMEEVAADRILDLYENEEDFVAAIERIINGTDEKAKKGARKFKDILNDLVRKLKNAVAKLTGREQAEAKQTLSEVEKLRDLYETALKAATDKAKAQKAENKSGRAEDSRGTISHHLKEVEQNGQRQNGKDEGAHRSGGTGGQTREERVLLAVRMLSRGAAPVRGWAEEGLTVPRKGSTAEAEAGTVANEYGLPVFVVQDAVFVKNHSKSPAFTAGGQVYLRETLPKIGRNDIGVHEAGHAMKQLGFRPYLDFIQRTPDMMNTSDVAQVIRERAAKHAGVDLLDCTDEEMTDVYDEINDMVMGAYHAQRQEVLNDVRKAFDDFDGYLAELADIHEQFKNRSGKQHSLRAGTTAEQAELSDANTQYSLRTKEPPKKVGIAYKVFFAKNGQLYPPMVANPGGEGTPVGVWLDADVGVSAGVSKTGRPQVKAGGKGTQGGGGKLAFRPGWHLGDLPLATQFNRVNPETGKKELFPADFVWAECEYAMDHDYQDEAMSYGYTDNGKFRHAYAGLPRLPEDGYYRYRTNPNPDTVPWVITGAMRVKRILTDAETDQILRDNGVEPLKRQGGPADLAKMGIKAGEQYSLKDSEGRELSKGQQDYFMDSTARDEAGHLLTLYHGTRKGGFTTFRDWAYLTASKGYAKRYADQNTGETVYEVYANITKPFDTRLKECRDLWRKEFFGNYSRTELQETGLPDWTDGYDLAEWIEENGYDYDGILLDEGADFDHKGELKERGISYVVRSSEQIKNVTNKQPTRDRDIRFSLKKGIEDYRADLEAAKRALADHKSTDIFAAPDALQWIEEKERLTRKVKRIEKKIADMSAPVIDSADPVDSKAFKVWFGDWTNGKGSKVVDADGRPLMVYHGTGTIIEEFLPEFTGQGVDQYGSGFYFTTNRSTAEGYQARTLNGQEKPGGMDAPNVIPVYLNIRHPIVVNAAETPHLYNFEVTPTMAARIIAKAPNIMDPEESILGDFIDEYWERGPQRYMITKLANEYDWSLGSLETDVFRDYPTEFRQAVKDVLGYDGVQVNFNSGEKHFVAWFPNQIKHATENSGAFSKNDNRIKFSLREHNDLMRENARLKEVNENLREQFKTTQFAKVDRKSLDAFAKRLLKDYSSGADINETRDALDALYTYIANGEDGLSPSWSEAYKRAYETAVGILEASSELDDEMYRQYKGLRDRLRKARISISPEHASDLMGYENLQDFRRRNMGRLNITKDGTPVDSIYAELAATYPELFDEYHYSTQGDQLVHISDVLESLRPMEVNPYSHNMRENATWLANDIMERFFELPQAKPTFADKAERKLTNLAIKDAKKLERLRDKKNERIRELIEGNREKVKQVQTKERDKRLKAVQEIKEHYKAKEGKASESRKTREMRAKILRHTTELSKKLLRASDKNHIPQELQGTVAKLLECINMESNYTYDSQTDSYKKNDLGSPTMRTRLFASLRKIYADMANELTIDPDLLGEDGLLTDVVELADKKMADMNLTELETIWKSIRAIEASIQSANIAFNQSRWETISEAAEALRMDNFGKKDKVELDGPFGALGKLQKLTGIDMMTPEAYFHRLGKSGDALFRLMRDAQDDHIRKMKAVSDFTHEQLDGVNVRKLESKMHTVKLGGQEVRLSTAQIMELYVLMRREQAREHIMIGGILPDVVSQGKLKKITRAKPIRGVQITELLKAFDLLTEEQKRVAEMLQEYASTQLSAWGNEAAMRVYNYEKFSEKMYWPIRVNRQETNSSVQKDTQVTSVAGRGFTKGTKPHASNSVMIGSIFDTFSTHASEMATYAAWLAPMEDINRIRNYSFKSAGETVDTVKGIIDMVHGKSGTAYLSKLLADLSNGVKGTHGETAYMSALVGNYKAASVGANLRVIIQQPTALLRALDMIDPQYLVAGMRPENGWKKAKKYAPIAQWKDWGYFDINTGRQMKDVLFDSDSKLDKVKSVSMAGAGMADSLSWGLLWNAVETETKHKRKDLQAGTEAFYETVAERFTEIVDHTQVVDGILQRSQIMRSADGLTKMATSFMGEPTKQYNMMMSAAYDAAHGVKSGKKHFVRAAMTLAISGVANAMAQAIMDAVRDDDKEKEYWEKWLASFGDNLANTANPAGYIPFIKDIVSLIQGYDVSRMDMESIEKVLAASQNMLKALNGEGKYTIGAASANLFAEVARVAGVPVANLKREIKSFAMLAAVETDNYVMQYWMERVSLNMNYSSNAGTFMDILFNAYQNDQEAYEIIYKDMIASGYDADKLASAMESRMKKAEGVDKVSDLDQRFLHPDQQPEWDRTMSKIRSSGLWSDANSKQRDKLEDKLYGLVTDSKSGEELQDKIDAGRQYGLDETEYLLYTLALDMFDQPDDKGEYGSHSSQERADAILSLNTGDSEMAYLWGLGTTSDEVFEALDNDISVDAYIRFKSDTADIKSTRDANGKEVKGQTRKDKVIDYLNSMDATHRERVWLLATAYETVKKEAAYKQYFGG